MSSLRDDIKIMPQDLYTVSATQGTDLGSLATTGDGRYFRYVKVGATALVPGQIYQGPATDAVNWSPAGGLGVGQANATGAASFTVSASTTVTANGLQDAIMSVAVGTGVGYTYRIKGNSATSGATGMVIYLDDPLQTNLATDSRVVFTPNLYNGVIVCGTTLSAVPVGTALYPVAAAHFGWLQTKGLVSQYVASSGTPATNQRVGFNLQTPTGAVATVTGTAVFTGVGVMSATGASGEYDLVDLELEG